MLGGVVEPVVFSGSSVATYERCHLQWWFEYVAAAPHEKTIELQIGLELHGYAERLMSARLAGGPGCLLPVAEDEPEPTTELEELYFVASRDIEPVLVEAPFSITVDGIPYSGFIDLVDDQAAIRDIKTVGKRPHAAWHNQYGFDYSFAMTGYAMGFRQMTGAIESDLVLDYLVKTQTPYYWPISHGGPVEDWEVDQWRSRLYRAANSIVRRDYEPTGLGTWACAKCPFAAVCGPYQVMERE